MDNQFEVGDFVIVVHDFVYDELTFREGMVAEIRVLDEYPNSCRYGTHWLISEGERQAHYDNLHTLSHVNPETNMYEERSREERCGWWIPWRFMHSNTRLVHTDPSWEV